MDYNVKTSQNNNKEMLNKEMLNNKTAYNVEYVWLDSDNEFRSKTRVIYGSKSDTGEDFLKISNWNYDGSSTNQATVGKSEVTLIPLKLYYNREINESSSKKYYVLCDNGNIESSYKKYKPVFETFDFHEPMFGLEQEFFINDDKYKQLNLTQLNSGEIDKQLAENGKMYCGVNKYNGKYRPYLEQVLQKCMDYGVKVTGMNFEVAPQQAEIQVCNIGLDACYDLLMVRYFLNLVGESYSYTPLFEPKPFPNVNGTGCHINFSTKKIRDCNDKTELLRMINSMTHKLEKKHIEFIDNYYGSDNKNRLTGTNETCSHESFKVSVGGRDTSIRIPNKGRYFEDRRPGGNIDPYIACGELLNTCLQLNNKQ